MERREATDVVPRACAFVVPGLADGAVFILVILPALLIKRGGRDSTANKSVPTVPEDVAESPTQPQQLPAAPGTVASPSVRAGY
jgi:hypothetical protein